MSRQARVGLLVLAGVVLFLVALFAIANRSFLFSDTFFVGSRFNDVAGLQAGAAVRYQGVNVGRVERVRLPEVPGQPINVTMAIQESARHLIRENTQAQIQSDGLVGNQIITLVSAPQPAAPVEEGDMIPSVDPFNFTQVTDRLLGTVQRFEETAGAFEQIMLDVQAGEGTLGKFVYDPTLYNSLVQTADETQRLMANLGDDAEALVAIAEEATEGVNSILTKVDQGDGTFAKMLNDPAVYNTLLAASDTLLTITGDLRAVTSSAENAANWGSLGAYRFAELMEAAKHNWLFKRYFEERGYMEQAPFEVREQALAQTYEELQALQRELQAREARLEARETGQDATSANPSGRTSTEGDRN